MMQQIIARVDDDILTEVDQLVAQGVVASRSEAVRLGLARLVDRARRDRIGQQIAEGYLRLPETDEEVEWAKRSTVDMINEEPW